VKQITPAQLKEWMEQNHDFVLVDVREDFERELFNIGGLHIPMSELAARFREIPADKDVVLYCEKGIRSVIAIQRLEGAGWHNLLNLSGGMKYWKETV
jgi:adenylyltransferase/sulfurtransferase